MEGHIGRGLMATLGIDLAKVYPNIYPTFAVSPSKCFLSPIPYSRLLEEGGIWLLFSPCKLPVVNPADSHHLSTLFTYLVSLNKCLKLQICPVLAIICQSNVNSFLRNFRGMLGDILMWGLELVRQSRGSGGEFY